MKETDKHDLRNPTPPPASARPASARPPAAEVKKPAPEVRKPAEEPKKTAEPPKAQPQPEQKKPQKRGGLVSGIVVGILVAAAVLLAGYRFIHIWSDVTCDTKAKCSICGLEKEGYAKHTWTYADCGEPKVCSVCGTAQETPAGHSWTRVSCTEPRICSVCGETEEEAPGHIYRDGICTVCGAVQKNEVLKWEDKGYASTYHFDPDGCALSVQAPGFDKFAVNDIAIKDYAGTEVRTERYTVSRTEEEVTVHLPADLAPGRYTVCSGYFETEVADFYYGTHGDYMPVKEDCWYEEFVTKSRIYDRWLSRNDSEVLLGVQTEDAATRFGSPWQLCAVEYNDTDAIIVNDPNALCDKFRADEYLRIGGNGGEETVVVFQFENWYLAMSTNGEAYLTDTLTEECFWVITSCL